MKVELEKLVLAHSSLSDDVYVGVPSKTGGKWLHKANVTNSFIGAVISRWENQKEVIGSGDNKWEISVKKLK